MKDETGKPLPVPAAEAAKAEADADALLDGDNVLDGFAHFWQRLLEDPTPTPDKVADTAAILERGRFASLPDFSERFGVRKLTKLPATAYPDAARAMIQCEQMYSETLAALGDRAPEGFRRVKNMLTTADKMKQTAEDLLFKPRITSDEVNEARERFLSATQSLRMIRNGVRSIRNAHRAAAEATAELHAVLPAVIAWNKPDIDSWTTAARTASLLAATLAEERPFNPLDFQELDALAKKLRGEAALLTTHTPAQLKKLEEDANKRPEASTYTELQKLLAGATLAADDRAGIAAGFRKVSATRYWSERAKFDKEHIRLPAPHLKPEDAFLRTQRRAGGSFELMKLAALPKANELSLAASVAGNDEAKWQSLSERSVAEWRASAAIASDAAKKDRWREVERILRAAPPGLGGFNRVDGFGKLFDLEELDRRKWLAARFGEYGKLRSGVSGAVAFYAELAEDHDRPLVRVGK